MSKNLLPILVVIIVLLGSSLYIVKEGEQAIVIQFGKPIGNPTTDAG